MKLHRMAVAALLTLSLTLGISSQAPAAEDADELPTFTLAADAPYWGLQAVILWYGIDAGTFQDAGINMEIKDFDGTSLYLPALQQGEADGLGLLRTAYVCHSRDAENCNVVIAGVTNQVSPYLIIAHSDVVAEHPEVVENPAEVFLHTVGSTYNCQATPTMLVARMVHQENPDASIHCGGLEEGQAKPDVHLKPFGGTLLRTTAVAKRTKGAGAVVSFAPGHIEALRNYDDALRVLTSAEQVRELFGIPMNGLVVKESTDPGLVCRYMKGYQQAVARWKRNGEEALAYLQQHFEHRSGIGLELDASEARSLYELTKVMHPDSGTVSDAAMQEWARMSFQRDDVSLDGIVDFSMVPGEGESCPPLREG